MKINKTNAETIKGVNAKVVFRCKASDLPDRDKLEINESVTLDLNFGDNEIVMLRLSDCRNGLINGPLIGNGDDWCLRLSCGNPDINKRPQVYVDDCINDDNSITSSIVVMKFFDENRMPSDDWRVYVRADVYDHIKAGTIEVLQSPPKNEKVGK